ncbi:MAG: CapA family protein [Treponema sp.]|jgi:poly-gamma-glutamate synthesis protein (capsule biosynthesis protein)|nr:CapA family protein [Treponema sp.]
MNLSAPKGGMKAAALLLASALAVSALSCGKAAAQSALPRAVTETRWISWEAAAAVIYDEGGAFIPAKLACMVPAVHPADGLDGVTLRAAAAARLVALADLAPPFVAVKVDGLSADDPRYPLVRAEGPFYEAKRRFNGRERAFIEAEGKRLLDERGRAEPPRFYTIAAGGDAMMARGAQELLFERGSEEVFGGTAPFLKNADLALLNLEGVISDRGDGAQKAYVFRFSPRLPRALREAGVDAALIANNHVMDFGEASFLDTIDHLRAAGIFPLGAGRTLAEAAGFYETNAAYTSSQMSGAIRVYGIASFPRERSGFDGAGAAADTKRAGMLFAARGGEEALKKRLRENDEEGLDIVMFHGGVEYSDESDAATRALYTRLVEAGADLLVGSHPHVEQGFEWVRGKPVFWSLGDYVFADMEDTPGGDKGLFVVLRYRANRLVYLDPYPLQMKGPRTVIGPREQLERFYTLTRKLR